MRPPCGNWSVDTSGAFEWEFIHLLPPEQLCQYPVIAGDTWFFGGEIVPKVGKPVQEISMGFNGYIEDMVVDEGNSKAVSVIAMQFKPRTFRCLDKQLSFARQLHTRKVGLGGMEDAGFKHTSISVVEKYAIAHKLGTVKGDKVRRGNGGCALWVSLAIEFGRELIRGENLSIILADRRRLIVCSKATNI